MVTTTSPPPSGSRRLGRLESQVDEHGQTTRTTEDKIDVSKGELEGILQRLGYLQEKFVDASDFLGVRNMVNGHDTRIIRLHQATVSGPAPSAGMLHLPLYSGDRSSKSFEHGY